MEKIKVPSQSKISIEKVFDSLQDATKINTNRRLKSVFKNFGIDMTSYQDAMKVTLSSDNIIINSGTAYTDDGEYINIPTPVTISINNAIDTTTGEIAVRANNTYYVVKLYWKNSGYGTPVAVANSFKYDANTSLTEEQRWATYKDDYLLSIGEITSGNVPTKASNEIILAVIRTQTSSTSIYGNLTGFYDGTDTIDAVGSVVDFRYLNMLEYDDIKLADSSTLEIANISPSSAGLTIKSSNDNLINFKDKDNNILLHVDPVNGSVGIGATTSSLSKELEVLGDINASGNIYVRGWKVLTEEIYSVKKILNFKINKITSIYTEGYRAGSVSSADFSLEKELKAELSVNMDWGYSTIEGTGGSNGSFTITNGTSGYTFADDELIGQYLYIPGSPGKNYYIADNVGNVLTLHDEYAVPANMSGVSLVSPTFAKINSNASSYEIIATPYTTGDMLDNTAAVSNIITLGSPIVSMAHNMRLASGTNYQIKIRAIRGYSSGDWAPLLWSSASPDGAVGSFTYMGVNYSYGPLGKVLVRHVPILDTNATFTAVGTSSGFKATLTPSTDTYNWSNVDAYEFAWTNGTTTINWADKSTYESRITTKTVLSVSTHESTKYNIAVRALIGMLATGFPRTTTVNTGTGGALPANNIIATTKVEHYTFSGSFTEFDNSDINNPILTFGTLFSPSETTNSVSFSNLKPGYILTTGAKDFRLVKKLTDTQWKIEKVDTGSSTWPSSGGSTYEIGTSLAARKIYSSILQTDTQITKLEAVCSVHEGEKIIARAYQLGRAGEEHVIIEPGPGESSASGKIFSQSCDLILSNNGGLSRTLVLDLWDDSINDYNDGAFVGTINVYGQSYSDSIYAIGDKTT